MLDDISVHPIGRSITKYKISYQGKSCKVALSINPDDFHNPLDKVSVLTNAISDMKCFLCFHDLYEFLDAFDYVKTAGRSFAQGKIDYEACQAVCDSLCSIFTTEELHKLDEECFDAKLPQKDAWENTIEEEMNIEEERGA